jgi:membrane-associated protein
LLAAWLGIFYVAGRSLSAKNNSKPVWFDLKEHLEVIVLGIVLVTTLPVLIKIFSRPKDKNSVIK